MKFAAFGLSRFSATVFYRPDTVSYNASSCYFSTLVYRHKKETLMVREASIRGDFHMKALSLFNPTSISTGLTCCNNLHALLKQSV